MNEDSNAKLIRELKEEIGRLRNLLKTEGIMVEEGETNRKVSLAVGTVGFFAKSCAGGFLPTALRSDGHLLR